MSEREMLKIAEKAGDLHILAAHLNMSSDLDTIKADNPSQSQHQRFLFLKQWYQKGGERPELAQALNETGNKTLATQ